MSEEQDNNGSPRSITGQDQHQHSYRFIFIGGLLGFVLGVLGNLLAAWFEGVILGNAFTTGRVAAIIAIAIGGLIIAAWWDWRHSTSNVASPSVESKLQNNKVQISAIQAWWSRFKIRGSGIKIRLLSSIGSKFDIDTRDNVQDISKND